MIKTLKFKAEGREFSKNFRSLEQFIQTVKGQNNYFFVTRAAAGFSNPGGLAVMWWA